MLSAIGCEAGIGRAVLAILVPDAPDYAVGAVAALDQPGAQVLLELSFEFVRVGEAIEGGLEGAGLGELLAAPDRPHQSQVAREFSGLGMARRGERWRILLEQRNVRQLGMPA